MGAIYWMRVGYDGPHAFIVVVRYSDNTFGAYSSKSWEDIDQLAEDMERTMPEESRAYYTNDETSDEWARTIVHPAYEAWAIQQY